jgi:hypothetical protein
MRLYVAATGATFALLALSHVARFIAEGAYLLREPIFILTTLVSLAFVAWAIVVLVQKEQRPT